MKADLDNEVVIVTKIAFLKKFSEKNILIYYSDLYIKYSVILEQ